MRYRRNHELLNMIFDARSIDSLAPQESPYAQVDRDALQEQIHSVQEQIQKMEKDHEAHSEQWRSELEQQESVLHSTPKQLRQQQEAHEEASDDDTPVWARSQSKGRILGVGYIRASTPDEVKALLPRPAELPAQQPSAPSEERRSQSVTTGEPASAQEDVASQAAGVAPVGVAPTGVEAADTSLKQEVIGVEGHGEGSGVQAQLDSTSLQGPVDSAGVQGNSDGGGQGGETGQPSQPVEQPHTAPDAPQDAAQQAAFPTAVTGSESHEGLQDMLMLDTPEGAGTPSADNHV